MLGLEAFALGDPWNVGLACLRAVAGFAKDLEVIGFVCPAEGEGYDMINIPSLSGLDCCVASLAGSLLIKEEVEAEGCGEGLAAHFLVQFESVICLQSEF